MENETRLAETMDLAEERLRLEREALAVERERLATARAHADEAARLAVRQDHRWLWVALVVLLVLLSFAGGLMAGVSLMESRQEQQRSTRLAHALAKLGDVSQVATTNAVVVGQGGRQKEGHRDVAVVVIQ